MGSAHFNFAEYIHLYVFLAYSAVLVAQGSHVMHTGQQQLPFVTMPDVGVLPQARSVGLFDAGCEERCLCTGPRICPRVMCVPSLLDEVDDL